MRASDGAATSAGAPLTLTVSHETAGIRAFWPEAITVDGADGDVDSLAETMMIGEEPDGELSADLAGARLASARPIALQLTPTAPGPAFSCSATNTAYPSATSIDATASCALADVPANVYEATATIGPNGFFRGSGTGIVTVVNPALGFTTGGGRVAVADAASLNFRADAKAQKNGQVQGTLLAVAHGRDGSWAVRSNVFSTLQQARTASGFWIATMTGKATLAAPITLPCGQAKCGNYSFTAYIEDRAEPGSGQDQFWLRVTDPGGHVVAAVSLPTPAAANALTLVGGNVQVPQPQRR